MKILLSNDDGIESRGLIVMAQALHTLAELYICTPNVEYSGASHSITAYRPLQLKRMPDQEYSDHIWTVNGTPADCVKLALDQLVPELPDIVISGINPGANLGTDIVYSGTVAAAREGFFHGCMAIAVSCCNMRKGQGKDNFQCAADITCKLCRSLEQQDFSPRMLLNVNVPGSCSEDIKGIKTAYMGWRWYDDAFTARTDPHGRPYYWLHGAVNDDNCGEDSDVDVCNKGYISITPLQTQQTDMKTLEYLNKCDLLKDL